jgi:hypothetical protein
MKDIRAVEKKMILSVYFHDECIGDLADLEIQTDEETAHSILERIEKADPDKMFRLMFNKIINLRAIKLIKIEELEDGDLYDYDKVDDNEA